MTPGARIQAAIELWDKIWTAGVPMDTLTGDYFRVRRYIGAKDRAAIAERVYAMMRHYARAGWWLARVGGDDTPRTRMIADLTLRDHVPRPHVADLFSGAKHAPESLSEQEARILDALAGQNIDSPEMPEAVRAECPPEAEERLRAVFGDGFAHEMAAMLIPAPLDLRANTIKISRDDAIAALAKHGVETAPTAFSPVGLRAPGRVHLAETKLLQAGVIEIQDEGSQLIALLCAAGPGMQVLDACAGGGGKTLAIAAQMAGKGRIVAMDTSAQRLARGKPRYVRAGIHNVELRALSDEQNVKWLRRQKGNFDVVLVDAPCTSSGTWRRNPDLRWRAMGPGADEIVREQAQILERFAKCVKPGGLLVYATCSLYRAENEAQVEVFLGAHPDFALVPLATAWTRAGLNGTAPKGEMMRLSPLQSGTDGFFCAVMQRGG
ncbi:MAG: RsmB/NOP family class I SAM-dependent RNA methyltransferase [Rhodospirillales bacterium]|nr:RsmB/NOP family class I SAM-dependent RNA methyltransferase [Alphaproteobacteria bacterium]MCB9986457.1 RsmB/NOP family class I SAM-dependent RNA methyltransferase [Rhodospirillales bacterium]USO06997.1 MAG: RsmB/NOP family class I SAM-dependent RNA methyltransferase [Rhodospirillales bacterium]